MTARISLLNSLIKEEEGRKRERQRRRSREKA
jgi:hypothetical protein